MKQSDRSRRRSRREVGLALAAWRERHNLSQVEAALKLRISPRTLQEWEQGRARPHHMALEALREKIAR